MNMFRKFALTSAIALSFGAAHAGTDTTTFAVSAEVVDSCQISATAMAFGQIDPIASVNTDATSTVTVTCSNGTTYAVGLDAGATTGATVTARQMLSGTDTLNYALYSDSGRTTNWGSGTTEDVDGTGTGTNQALTVYGRVPSGQQTAPTGVYSDTITVTVSY